MILELAVGAAFVVCVGVLVAQLTGWRPPRRSWGAAPIVGDPVLGCSTPRPVVPPQAPGNRVLGPPTQRVEVVIRIEVQGPDA